MVNVPKLKTTIMKLRGELSKAFDHTTGIFSYGEIKVELTGRLEKRMLLILTNNFNNVVDRDEVYKYVYKGDALENDIEDPKATIKASAYARLEEMFKSLKRKFNILSKDVVLKQERGYGIFSK